MTKPPPPIREEGSGEVAWTTFDQMPEVGQKFIALYNDGSGAAMFWRHDDGFISHDGDEYPHDTSWKNYDRWAYLPDLEFWCENWAEDPLSLPVTTRLSPPLPAPEGGEVESYALGLLVEECGEVAQLVGKALRFGIDTPGVKDPLTGHIDMAVTPRTNLHTELGDVIAAIDFAAAAGLIDKFAVSQRAVEKFARLTNPDARDNLGRRLAPRVAGPAETETPRKDGAAPQIPIQDGGFTDLERGDAPSLRATTTDQGRADAPGQTPNNKEEQSL